MPNTLYTIIEFPRHENAAGGLSAFQNPNIPFTMKKVLIIDDLKNDQPRGGHTHHKTNQVLVCIKGSCAVDLDDGKRKESVTLDTGTKGLLLYPYVWHVMRNFTPDTILLVIADTEYDEKDYIRSYDEFLKLVT